MACYRRPDKQGKCCTCASMGCSFFSRFHLLSSATPSPQAANAVRSLLEMITLSMSFRLQAMLAISSSLRLRRRLCSLAVTQSTVHPILLRGPVSLVVLMVLVVLVVGPLYNGCIYFGQLSCIVLPFSLSSQALLTRLVRIEPVKLVHRLLRTFQIACRLPTRVLSCPFVSSPFHQVFKSITLDP